MVIGWRTRVWRCPDPACPVATFSETHPLIGPRAKVTTRAIACATGALAHHDTTVSALVRLLGVDCHTALGRDRGQGQAADVRSPAADRVTWKPASTATASLRLTIKALLCPRRGARVPHVLIDGQGVSPNNPRSHPL